MNDSQVLENENFAEDEKKVNSVVLFLVNTLEVCIQASIVVVFIFNFFFKSITVEGDSMVNTLQNRDKMFIVSSFLCKPKQKDVVIVNTVDILDLLIVKRIVAVEGQTVDIKKEGPYCYLFIDGVKQNEEYIKEAMEQDNIGDLKYPIKIPTGYVFVMGDNRNDSKDSRHIGLVNLEKITGVCRAVLFPLRNFKFFK